MDRETSGSARATMKREEEADRVKRLEAENARLQRTVVGLGALVAEACMKGYIHAATPEGNEDGKG